VDLDIAGVRRALNEWAFRAKHIPGSEHFNTSGELFSSLRPDEEVVVYCTSVDCHASLALYHELVARDYRDVRRYEGGLTMKSERPGTSHGPPATPSPPGLGADRLMEAGRAGASELGSRKLIGWWEPGRPKPVDPRILQGTE
jgi:rhodanese-related sulfurtransferase